MNWLDFTLIGVITMGTLFGIITGPLWQIYRISSVALSVAVALLLHKLLSSIIKEVLDPKISSILGYAIIFGVTLIVTYAVGNLFRRFLVKRKFGMSGRLIGGGISFTKTVITCCVVIAGVSFWGNSQAKNTIDGSVIAKNLDKGTKKVIPLFPQEIKDMAIDEKEVSEKKEI
ncbi:MAG: CvpA family protein, partial [Candidatus Scalindua sp.]|nr:CvpA family protein [Candidatus Scalindua sp.]